MAGQVVAMKPSQAPAIQGWLDNETVRKKFTEVLDKGANAFIGSLLSLVKSSPQLQTADPKTVMSAAMTAATLKLPINPNLGFAYIVPYKSDATFQMGYKGYIQLAMRTGQYETINASVVYEGQVKDIDFLTGEIVRGKKVSDEVIGYAAYFKLINGFSKTLYMTKEEMENHAREFSQSYAYDLRSGKKTSVWRKNFNAMALKTVLKLLISKYGIMSIDMQSADMTMAIQSDGAAIRKVGESYDYLDNDGKGYSEPEEAEPSTQAVDNPVDNPVDDGDIGLGLE